MDNISSLYYFSIVVKVVINMSEAGLDARRKRRVGGESGQEGKDGTSQMVQFKACPRCSGDMKQTRDMYGKYNECLQCGYTKDILPEPNKTFDWAKTRGKPGRRRKTKAAA